MRPRVQVGPGRSCRKMLGRTFPEIRAARPDPAVVARALDGLLQNLAVERCQLNEGYVRALGLTPTLPQTSP